MSSNTLRRRAALAVVLGFLAFGTAACTNNGSGGSSGSGSSSSSGSGSSSGSTAAFASFPEDFTMPYVVPSPGPGQGVYLVPASNPAAPVLVVAGNIPGGVVLGSGSFAGGVVTNSRPAVYAYVEGTQWFRLDLRSGTTAATTAFGVETQAVCDVGFSDGRPDFAAVLHSYLFYTAAGVDGSCHTADDELHALRLDDAATATPRKLGSGSTSHVLRSFLNSDGSVAGFLIQVGSELRHYDAALASFTTLVTGIQGFAGNVTFGRTSSVVYARYQDTSSTAYLLKCNLDGSFSTVYSATHARLGPSTSDVDAIYIAQATSGVTPAGPEVLMRIPYDSSKPATTIYTGGSGTPIFVVLGTTPNTVVISTGGGTTLQAVSKSGATGPVIIATATNNNIGFNEFQGTFVTGDGRIVWTGTNGDDSSGNPTSTVAGISDEHGSMLEQHANSEWVSPAYGNLSFSTPTATPVLGGVLVRSYTGSYATDGHKGGTIAFYDFTTGATTDVATIPDQARLAGVYADGISAQVYNVLGPVANTDVAVTDLRNNRFTRVTNTPNVSEQVQ